LNIAADATLQPFMAGTFRVKQSVKSHDLANRLRAHIWLSQTYAIPACIYICESDMGYSFLTTRYRIG
jgi:hypothetical protein